MENYNLPISYSSYYLINMKNKKFFVKEKATYNYSKNKILNSYSTNTFKYILQRNPVPIVFGIFKTKKFSRSMLKYYKIFDESRANYENLYLIDFLANNEVAYLNKKLFSYRERDRVKLALVRSFEKMNF